MMITQATTLQADAGWRMFPFLKVTISDHIVSRPESDDSSCSGGLPAVVKGLSPILTGWNPRGSKQFIQHLPVDKHSAAKCGEFHTVVPTTSHGEFTLPFMTGWGIGP